MAPRAPSPPAAVTVPVNSLSGLDPKAADDGFTSFKFHGEYTATACIHFLTIQHTLQESTHRIRRLLGNGEITIEFRATGISLDVVEICCSKRAQ